ncbi:elongation factor 4 [Mycoplasma sp. (ex Biomphalaria glabrata)]|uniref:Translation factor GUF1 homolog, mitochondrial n=1 Tax=Biomphalaria glabrata TaxID=6526 RepID=A0A182ZC50_BIOGL|nr:translation elongation factor 4 [Mycoplasma sp. (ex Biomphalaria glabrata)]ALV23574.1 elongation factor 4 [Mycoplasma sp. (ex Biomphalaria glabrata)]
MNKKNIRNFCIIAHIDHGKSTLADRILEHTKKIKVKSAQLLDDMELEKERGITIKLNTVTLNYIDPRTDIPYKLHLIDTPGHVDFNYEVSRSLAACEGAILVVDSSQGVQAQTISNVYLAIDNNLEIIPVLNKIDLPQARPDDIKREIENIIGIDCTDAPLISAKTGLNIEDVFNAIIDRIPSPNGDENKPLQALIFDSYYDNHRGVVILICVKEGNIKIGDELKFIHSKHTFKITNITIKTPEIREIRSLEAGDIGMVSGNIKDVSYVKIGDTLVHASNKNPQSLPGYKVLKPMVFMGIFPVEREDYEQLRDALAKISLSDSSLTYEQDSSDALGFGYRCGFLGLLHAEIIQERLEREYNLKLIATAPSVQYHITTKKGEQFSLDNPKNLPPLQNISSISEPYVNARIITPIDFIGNVLTLAADARGIYITTNIIDDTRHELVYEFPLSEIIFDFFNNLKSASKGYASFDYEFKEYKISDLAKMEILINGEVVDPLSMITHKEKAYYRGKHICERLKELIPKKQFEIPIQAAINNKVIARETIKAYRKNVLAKCYGGDISRKRKLLEKQKEGKKRMKMVGSVEIPQTAFLSVLNIGDKNNKK